MVITILTFSNNVDIVLDSHVVLQISKVVAAVVNLCGRCPFNCRTSQAARITEILFLDNVAATLHEPLFLALLYRVKSVFVGVSCNARDVQVILTTSFSAQWQIEPAYLQLFCQ